MLLFGLLRLGNALRFIPNSVMSSFTHSVGFLIILGQLSSLTGYDAQGPNKPMQTIDLLRHLDQVDIPSLITGLVTIALLILLKKTPIKNFSILASMFLASLLPLFLGWEKNESNSALRRGLRSFIRRTSFKSEPSCRLASRECGARLQACGYHYCARYSCLCRYTWDLLGGGMLHTAKPETAYKSD